MIKKTKTIIKNYHEYRNIDLKAMGLNVDQMIILSITGSNMYGTATPTSDKDYIGVYIPTKEQLLLNNVPHHLSLPKSSGVDCQIWSIHCFLKLLCKGETMAMDLLHSPYHCWLLYDFHVWPFLSDNANSFYTKSMNAFIGYARKQASVYGAKGSRMKELEEVIKFLKMEYSYARRLSEIWKYLPKGEHIHFLENESPRLYQVCGRKLQETAKIGYVLSTLEHLLTSYGKRANMAKNNKGVDWKALSHAIRSAEQVYWILKYGKYKYPLKNSKFIKMVKEGKIAFEMAQAVLEDYMNEIERLIEISTLPNEVDKKYWNKWLINLLESYLAYERNKT